MASTINNLTRNLDDEWNPEKYNIEDQISRCGETECMPNVSKLSSELMSPCTITGRSVIFYNDACFHEDAPSSKTKSLPSSSQILFKYFTEESTIPKNQQYSNECCSSENNSCHNSTEDDISTEITVDVQSCIALCCLTNEASCQPQNSNEQTSITSPHSTYEVSLKPQISTDNSPICMSCLTHETLLETQNSTIRRSIENSSTMQSEHDRLLTVTSSISQLSPQFLISSWQNFGQSISRQNEMSPESKTHKSFEFISISTIGPPPLYNPTLRYEPASFYEPPPPYTSFSLDSCNIEEISEIGTQESSDNESSNRLRIELVRFISITIVTFLAIKIIMLIKT